MIFWPIRFVFSVLWCQTDQIPNRRVVGTDRNAICWYFALVRLCLAMLFIITIFKIQYSKFVIFQNVVMRYQGHKSLNVKSCTKLLPLYFSDSLFPCHKLDQIDALLSISIKSDRNSSKLTLCLLGKKKHTNNY